MGIVSSFRRVACGSAIALAMTVSAHAETLMLVNSDAIGSITDRMNVYFAEDLEKRSGGDIKVNYIAGNSLGSGPQVMDQLIAYRLTVVRDEERTGFNQLIESLDHLIVKAPAIRISASSRRGPVPNARRRAPANPARESASHHGLILFFAYVAR